MKIYHNKNKIIIHTSNQRYEGSTPHQTEHLFGNLYYMLFWGLLSMRIHPRNFNKLSITDSWFSRHAAPHVRFLFEINRGGDFKNKSFNRKQFIWG